MTNSGKREAKDLTDPTTTERVPKRRFRSEESISFERATRDMLSEYLCERGFRQVRDVRKAHGKIESQKLKAISPEGEEVVMRVRLCWRRSKRTLSAAQLLSRIKGQDWETEIDAKLDRERADGITHFLFVQRDDEQLIWAALVPIAEVLPIWIRQHDISAAILLSGASGRRTANRAKNGSSPTIWLQDDSAPEIAQALWDCPGVVDLASIPVVPGASSAPILAQSHDEAEELFGLEGEPRRRLVLHRKRERRAREAKIASVLASNSGALACEVPGCDFDFCSEYGELGEGYTQVHHLQPLAGLEHEVVPRLDDLAVVCANCHAMIHRGGKCRPLKEIASARSASSQETKKH